MSRTIIAALIGLAACGPLAPGGFSDEGGEGGGGVAADGGGGAGGEAWPRRCGEPGETHRVLSSKPDSSEYLEGCEIVESLVWVEFYGIPDLSMLSTVREIRGGLMVDNTNDLVSLRGAENLEAVGPLRVMSAPLLRTIEPLGGLRRVEHLLLGSLPLTSLSGLDEIQEIPGDVILWHLNELTSLEGLGRLRRVGNLDISTNDRLTSLAGLDSLEHVTGALEIRNNPSLPRAEVLAFLERVRVDGPVVINDNGP